MSTDGICQQIKGDTAFVLSPRQNWLDNSSRERFVPGILIIPNWRLTKKQLSRLLRKVASFRKRKSTGTILTGLHKTESGVWNKILMKQTGRRTKSASWAFLCLPDLPILWYTSFYSLRRMKRWKKQGLISCPHESGWHNTEADQDCLCHHTAFPVCRFACGLLH